MRRHRKLNNGGRCTTTEISSRIRQSLVLFLIASSVVMAQQPCGSFVCENGGQCLDLFQQRTNSSLLSKIQVSGDLLLQCICPPGYGGITCSYNHGQICDGSKKKQCKNNSPCIANKLVPNVTECPCDAAYTLSNFAGDMCEQPATEYCQLAWSHESQEQHFCTNGGRCIGTDTSPTDDTGISEEGYTWGMVMGDTPIGCQCRKYTIDKYSLCAICVHLEFPRISRKVYLAILLNNHEIKMMCTQHRNLKESTAKS